MLQATGYVYQPEFTASKPFQGLFGFSAASPRRIRPAFQSSAGSPPFYGPTLKLRLPPRICCSNGLLDRLDGISGVQSNAYGFVGPIARFRLKGTQSAKCLFGFSFVDALQP